MKFAPTLRAQKQLYCQFAAPPTVSCFCSGGTTPAVRCAADSRCVRAVQAGLARRVSGNVGERERLMPTLGGEQGGLTFNALSSNYQGRFLIRSYPYSQRR